MAQLNASQAEAMEFKTKGNEAHQSKDFRGAIYYFSKGLELDPGPAIEHVLLSNRSASYCLLEDYELALRDADRVIELKPGWAKGYSRKGAALHGLKRFQEAITVFEKGLELDGGSDVMRTAREESEKSHVANYTPPCDLRTIKPETQHAIAGLRNFKRSDNEHWHLEILKDRIWLADPPKPPFRPRSLFLVDSRRLQLLDMLAHPTRGSINLDELLTFVLKAIEKHQMIPGVLEFSDPKLQHVLVNSLDEMGISCRTIPLSPGKDKFFVDTVSSYEEKEAIQWKGNPKFTGVLRQRVQPSLKDIPGADLNNLPGFFSSAALFFRSKVYLYFVKGLGIKLSSEDVTRVALITRNNAGQYGLAMSTPEANARPNDCGAQCCIFSETSNLPFDDVDLVEQHGWEIEDNRFPLPVLHTSSEDKMDRPSIDDLYWYEYTFRAVTLAIEHSFKKPTFKFSSNFTVVATVNTSRGPAEVRVTVPPRKEIGEGEEIIRVAEPPPQPIPAPRSDPPTRQPPMGRKPHAQAQGEGAHPRPQGPKANAQGELDRQRAPRKAGRRSPVPKAATYEAGDVPPRAGTVWREEAARLPAVANAWMQERQQRDQLLHTLGLFLTEKQHSEPSPDGMRAEFLGMKEKVAHLAEQVQSKEVELQIMTERNRKLQDNTDKQHQLIQQLLKDRDEAMAMVVGRSSPSSSNEYSHPHSQTHWEEPVSSRSNVDIGRHENGRETVFDRLSRPKAITARRQPKAEPEPQPLPRSVRRKESNSHNKPRRPAQSGSQLPPTYHPRQVDQPPPNSYIEDHHLGHPSLEDQSYPDPPHGIISGRSTPPVPPMVPKAASNPTARGSPSTSNDSPQSPGAYVVEPTSFYKPRQTIHTTNKQRAPSPSIVSPPVSPKRTTSSGAYAQIAPKTSSTRGLGKAPQDLSEQEYLSETNNFF